VSSQAGIATAWSVAYRQRPGAEPSADTALLAAFTAVFAALDVSLILWPAAAARVLYFVALAAG
jgi:hypothetical protein